MNMRYIITALLLFFLVPVCAQVHYSDEQKGIVFMLQGDMKKARKLLTKSYKEGNERAASYMATSYLMEDSTDVGVSKAMKWLLKVPDDSLSVRMLCELYNDSNSIFLTRRKVTNTFFVLQIWVIRGLFSLQEGLT
jgi:hypothetical protein